MHKNGLNTSILPAVGSLNIWKVTAQVASVCPKPSVSWGRWARIVAFVRYIVKYYFRYMYSVIGTEACFVIIAFCLNLDLFLITLTGDLIKLLFILFKLQFYSVISLRTLDSTKEWLFKGYLLPKEGSLIQYITVLKSKMADIRSKKHCTFAE